MKTGASDEAVLQVGHLSANWSSYDAAPTVDFALADPTVSFYHRNSVVSLEQKLTYLAVLSQQTDTV